MVVLMTEIANYIILILFLLYILYSFKGRKTNKYKTSTGHNILKQRIIIFLFIFIANMIVLLNTNNIIYLILMVLEALFLLTYMKSYSFFYPCNNAKLINHFCMFLSIGFVMIGRLDSDKLIKQFSIIAVASVISFFIPIVLKKGLFLKKMTMFFSFLGIFLLAAVLFLGNITYGAKINLSISGSTFSPIEFVKILFVFFIAGVYYDRASLRRVLKVSIISLIYIILLVLSKDLGGALIFFITFLVMTYVATNKTSYVFVGITSFSAAGYIAYKIFYHVQIRINTWTTPLKLLSNDTSQISQALFAISSGGLFGVGINCGLPKIIPVVVSDLIFSAICEELGLLFGICLILLYLLCFLQIAHLSSQLSDSYYRLIAIGLGAEFIFQAFLNIGGTIKFIPLTGITLPLISYGGSSAVEMVILFAILQGIFMLKYNRRQ